MRKLRSLFTEASRTKRTFGKTIKLHGKVLNFSEMFVMSKFEIGEIGG